MRKGINKNIVKNMTNQEYRNRGIETERIQSKSQRFGTYEVNKISLSCFNDKQYIADHGIKTLPYKHNIHEKDNEGNKTRKGINKNVVKNVINQEYINRGIETKRIQSKSQRFGTYEVNKISLSCFNVRWCQARELFGLQIPVTTGGNL